MRKIKLFGIFTLRKPKFALQTLDNGRTAIVNTKSGDIFKDYARARDAKRGAERAGLELV